MMYDEEILQKGYKKVDEKVENLYTKEGKLFAQYHGEMKEASDLTEEQLRDITSFTAYMNELKKLGGDSESKEEKPPKQPDTKKSIRATDRKTTEIVLRGSEDDITRVVKARRMDLIIEASADKKNPGKGILYYDEAVIGEEPSVQLIDMITTDMGDIETEVVMLEEKHHVNKVTGFSVDTYCAIVRATDKSTGASGLGTSEEVINWDDWTREKNPKSFTLTNAIRKAERNAKERIIPVPRKVIVTLIKKLIQEHIAGKKQK